MLQDVAGKVMEVAKNFFGLSAYKNFFFETSVGIKIFERGDHDGEKTGEGGCQKTVRKSLPAGQSSSITCSP